MSGSADQAQPSDPPAPHVAGGRIDVLAIAIIVVTAAAVVMIDQIVKHAITGSMTVGEVTPLLGSVLQLHYVENSGAAFSLGENFTWVLSLVAIGVVVFIVWYSRRIRSRRWGLVFGLLLGGAIGNLADRMFRGSRLGEGRVVDFVQLWGFPAIFNIADTAIVLAMAMFILLTLLGVRLDGRRVHRHHDDGDQSAPPAPAGPA